MNSLIIFVHLAFLASAFEGAEPEKSRPIEQPIPFSHKSHLELGLECTICHASAETAERASLPELGTCMNCHDSIDKESTNLRKLNEFARSNEPVPWVQVYQLPFYVFFSHALHSKANVPCQSCHGPVQDREALWPEGDISMTGCIDCHQKKNISLECHICHELNQ